VPNDIHLSLKGLLDEVTEVLVSVAIVSFTETEQTFLETYQALPSDLQLEFVKETVFKHIAQSLDLKHLMSEKDLQH